MKRILRRRPSPALLVSFIALFAALGGSAYALTITGANIRNGTVRGADVKNYSLTGKDIARDSLGRVPIKEERLDATKLGKVKSAGAADSVGGVTTKRIARFALSTNGSKELLRQGPLVFSARCRMDGADQAAEIVVQTAQNGAAVDGVENDPQLNIGETVVLARAAAAPGTPSFQQAGAGAAIAPDGTEVLGQELYTGTSVIGQVNVCQFGGAFDVG